MLKKTYLTNPVSSYTYVGNKMLLVSHSNKYCHGIIFITIK